MLGVVEQLIEDVAKVAAAPLWSVPGPELPLLLQAVHRLQGQAAALEARIVHQAEIHSLPAAQGHRTTVSWLRSHLRIDQRPAYELVDQAKALATHPGIEQAVLSGDVDLRQAVVIAESVDAVPETLRDAVEPGETPPASAPIVAEAQAELIKFAGRFPAQQLRRLGERILAHVAPEVGERAEEAALRRQEARAHAKRFFTLSPPVDGVVRLSGSLGVEDAAVVAAALNPLCAPVRDDTRTPGQRRADALVDICRLALRTGDLPESGGEPPQVTVTVSFDPATQQLGTANLDTGERVSAQTARRMGCDARVLPVVLGGAGQVLDAGRSRRLASGPLRGALVARDRGCAFPDCDRPARSCDAHHIRHWSAGGHTKLDNLVLLCGHHHRVIHEPKSGWRARMATDGLPEFLPPPWIDRAGRPRRNLYHPRT
ncbi:MAG: DUF222 domain-containing protein [Actinoplanes sp.]